MIFVIFISAILASLILSFAYWRFRSLFPIQNQVLRVLMYHKLSNTTKNELTVLGSDFEAQLLWLKQNHYKSISSQELILHLYQNAPLPPKPVLITFDDGYINNLDIGLPLLKKYGMKATIFLPIQHIGGTNVWDNGNEPLVDVEHIKQNHGETIEFALHSFAHMNYRFKTEREIEEDLEMMQKTLLKETIPFVSAFAYPYGGLPKKQKEKEAIKRLLKKYGIQVAFRIKDKLNPLPIRDPYELLRIGISGSDSLEEFSYRVNYGSRNLF
ncbi:MAG: polysaccharide deacetylase family protein [Chloroherpetonaceae bacterium]|nr:polysaccharide deacetylase family protein [Chloroherpetonaceae bacterium]